MELENMIKIKALLSLSSCCLGNCVSQQVSFGGQEVAESQADNDFGDKETADSE